MDVLKTVKGSALAMGVKRVLYGRFAVMAATTSGMLSPATYRRIHQRVLDAPDLDFIEVGAAGGSVTVAMGWALKESGKSSSVVAVEKCEGGSRDRYGDFDDNFVRLNHHLQMFGMSDRVRLFTDTLREENGHDVLAIVRSEQISGFVHDADGRIERDFAFFLPRLHDAGFIIIDDYHPTRTWKHALTFRLLNQFVDWRLVVIDDVDRGTVFASKHPDADISRLDMKVCAGIVEGVRRQYGRAGL